MEKSACVTVDLYLEIFCFTLTILQLKVVIAVTIVLMCANVYNAINTNYFRHNDDTVKTLLVICSNNHCNSFSRGYDSNKLDLNL